MGLHGVYPMNCRGCGHQNVGQGNPPILRHWVVEYLVASQINFRRVSSVGHGPRSTEFEIQDYLAMGQCSGLSCIVVMTDSTMLRSFILVALQQKDKTSFRFVVRFVPWSLFLGGSPSRVLCSTTLIRSIVLVLENNFCSDRIFWVLCF